MPPRLFDSFNPANRQQRSDTRQICYDFNRAPSKGNLAKLKRRFAQCGEQVFIEQGFQCDYGDKIHLGDRVFVNVNCVFLDGGNIFIGDDCLIGPGVQLLTAGHPLSPKQRLQKEILVEDVKLGNNVWIGAGSIILPGTQIGDGTVIGAASLVTGNIEANSLYYGSPAYKIRDLD